MKELLGNAISSELIFVYGLIALVILLIVVIVIIDRRERKKEPKSLFDTLNILCCTGFRISQSINKTLLYFAIDTIAKLLATLLFPSAGLELVTFITCISL